MYTPFINLFYKLKTALFSTPILIIKNIGIQSRVVL